MNKDDPGFAAAKAKVEELAGIGWDPAKIFAEGNTGFNRNQVAGIVFRWQDRQKHKSVEISRDGPPSKRANMQHAGVANKLENAKLRAAERAAEPKVRRRVEPTYDERDFQFGGARSPFPAPSRDLPYLCIAAIARYLYEGKPLPNSAAK